MDANEIDGLLVRTITTKGELDELEQLNIEAAIEWTIKKKFTQEEVLSELFINGLHKRMYRDVWRWAGKFRKTEKNIGTKHYKIPTELRALVEDCNYWIENKTFSEDEIAIRFKHRIVSIHCYANGNGRHSRLMADVIVSHLFERAVFTWGRGNLSKTSKERISYLEAIRAADDGNYDLLVKFARS